MQASAKNNKLFRVEIGPKTDNAGPGMALVQKIRDFLGIIVKEVRIVRVLTVEGLDKKQIETLLENDIWHDPIAQRIALDFLPCLEPLPNWFCEIGLKPGVTDNEARIARETTALALDISKNDFEIYTSHQYRFVANADHLLRKENILKICQDLLCNKVIQRYRIMDYAEWLEKKGFPPQTAKVETHVEPKIHVYDLTNFSDQQLEETSRKNTWALTLRELKTIKAWFAEPEVRRTRKEAGISPEPTDVEMEALAQTWSEHCKHKIFSSLITYKNLQTGQTELIDNLYKTCIRDATGIIRHRVAENDYCHSVFKDNAGVIAFINGYDVCIKVETHNSPSALDPYGGALTGIVGVNRDPLGTGMGADLVCNIDVFCFAPPDYAETLPPRILHPARVLDGVRKGVEDGGNQSGIPTVNGSIVFDNRYLGKPLVFCGTVGLLPNQVCGHPGYEKKALPGDIIVMAGGKIGKDGIHGATFSSEELHVNSPATAVQIGDPITQRKLYDFILRARDCCLYNSITDNGAGGLSSSVGEMAEDSGGCILELGNAPLKYAGLDPWEILLSEAQERMTFAVPPAKLQKFLQMAKEMDVEATPLGEFTDSGFFEVRYNDQLVAYLDMNFMHHGDPQLELSAVWQEPQVADISINTPANETPAWQAQFLKSMLGRFNICSKEKIVRQYDHEVRGGSAVKPFAGVKSDGPTDGAVLRPLLDSDAGIVISHGICPKYGDIDTYWMMANAMDEAIRNAVCVGANPDFLAGVDNFCWCDPIKSSKNPDGDYKLGQLVRACKALRQFAFAYDTPCISGKDSMKNDYVDGSLRISIPPTVLYTVLGVMDNVTHAQTSDFKQPGDEIFLLGATWKELGCSEAANELGLKGGRIPLVDASSAISRYRALHGLINSRCISACHDCSDGGLAVALAEMCIGGRLGCEINLDAVCAMEKMSSFELLYSESASRLLVCVKPEFASLLEALGLWQICKRIGKVTQGAQMIVKSGDSPVMQADIQELVIAFKSGL